MIASALAASSTGAGHVCGAYQRNLNDCTICCSISFLSALYWSLRALQAAMTHIQLQQPSS
jgi:hypothetical protein